MAESELKNLVSSEFTIEGNAPTDEANERAYNIIKAIGPKQCEKFIWSVNWAYDGVGHNPTGYTLKMKKDALVTSQLFEPGQYCDGIAVMCLGTDVTLGNKSKFTEAYL